MDRIQKPFLHALVKNIKERLPNTDVFSNFKIFNPLKLPDTVENMCIAKYGEVQVEELGEKYGVGDSPLSHVMTYNLDGWTSGSTCFPVVAT